MRLWNQVLAGCVVCGFLIAGPPQNLRAEQAPAAGGKRVALLVGVNRYEKRGLNDLKYAERDVTDLAAELRKSGYEIHLLLGGNTGAGRATLQNIQREVAAALRGRTKQDLVLVGLAGHGLQIEVQENNKLRSESFFCPVDALRADPRTLLSMGWLFEQIDQRGGGLNVVLVDACREDPARGRGLDGSKVQNLPRGVAVMFGCDAGQKSFETDKAGGGHGVFFHFVLEGLRGGAANNQGNITWNALTEYVQEHVTDDAPGLLGNAQLSQTPNAFGNLSGKPLVLARSQMAPTVSAKRGTPPPKQPGVLSEVDISNTVTDESNPWWSDLALTSDEDESQETSDEGAALPDLNLAPRNGVGHIGR